MHSAITFHGHGVARTAARLTVPAFADATMVAPQAYAWVIGVSLKPFA
jgi:hypothetical protein